MSLSKAKESTATKSFEPIELIDFYAVNNRFDTIASVLNYWTGRLRGVKNPNQLHIDVLEEGLKSIEEMRKYSHNQNLAISRLMTMAKDKHERPAPIQETKSAIKPNIDFFGDDGTNPF